MDPLRAWLDHNDLRRLRPGVLSVRWTEFGWQTALVVVAIGYLFMVSVGNRHGGSPLLAAGGFLAGLALIPLGVRRRRVDLYADPACFVEGADRVALDPSRCACAASTGRPSRSTRQSSASAPLAAAPRPPTRIGARSRTSSSQGVASGRCCRSLGARPAARAAPIAGTSCATSKSPARAAEPSFTPTARASTAAAPALAAAVACGP